MPFNPCNPCDCIPGNIPDDLFHQMTLNVLCQILAGGGVAESVNIAAYGGVATSLGQKVMASSIPVVIASDQSAIAIAEPVTVDAITTSVTPGTAAANLGKAEDAVAASGDTGVFVLGVRADTPASTTTADGDYSQVTVNTSGVQYAEPANQVATYEADDIAGAGAGVPTTGIIVLTSTAKKKMVYITNELDVDAQASLNGGTSYPFYIRMGETLPLCLGCHGRWADDDIFVRAVGSDSSSGTLYVGAII